MINPLKVATSGYLKKGVKAALVISVAGYLSFGGGTVTTPTTDTHDGIANSELRKSRVPKERIARDDEDVMLIIKAFLECQ